MGDGMSFIDGVKKILQRKRDVCKCPDLGGWFIDGRENIGWVMCNKCGHRRWIGNGLGSIIENLNVRLARLEK